MIRFVLASMFLVTVYFAGGAGANYPVHPSLDRGTLLKIAVIDTGFDISRAQGQPKLCKSGHYDFAAKKAVVGFSSAHGTIVSSILAEGLEDVNYCIIAYNVQVRGRVDMPSVYEALRRARREGVVAVNMSLEGVLHSFSEVRELELTARRGIATFIAAGNDNKNLDETCNSYPACYLVDNTYIVGALTVDPRGKAQFSNYGSRVTIWKEGFYEFHGQYTEGTSFAAPRATSDYVLSLSRIQSK